MKHDSLFGDAIFFLEEINIKIGTYDGKTGTEGGASLKQR